MILDKNRELSEYYYVDASRIHGEGLYARVFIEKGEYMGTYQGPSVPDDGHHGPHVLWVHDEDTNTWLSRDGNNMLRYMNHHAKKPLAEFDGFDLYARRDIHPDEEIFIDYGEEPV